MYKFITSHGWTFIWIKFVTLTFVTRTKNKLINEYKKENTIQFLKIIYLCNPWFQLQQTNLTQCESQYLAH
jgi:hypothetical protein